MYAVTKKRSYYLIPILGSQEGGAGFLMHWLISVGTDGECAYVKQPNVAMHQP